MKISIESNVRPVIYNTFKILLWSEETSKAPSHICKPTSQCGLGHLVNFCGECAGGSRKLGFELLQLFSQKANQSDLLAECWRDDHYYVCDIMRLNYGRGSAGPVWKSTIFMQNDIIIICDTNSMEVFNFLRNVIKPLKMCVCIYIYIYIYIVFL